MLVGVWNHYELFLNKEGSMRRKKKMTNSFFLLPWEGSLCFWCLSTYKVWLSCVTFLRKYELPIWALWRAGNLTLNPMFWSIKGERKESNPGRWKVWKSDHEKRMLREDSTFKIVLKEWKQTFFCFLFSFLGYWETNQFLLLIMNFVCHVTCAAFSRFLVNKDDEILRDVPSGILWKKAFSGLARSVVLIFFLKPQGFVWVQGL